MGKFIAITILVVCSTSTFADSSSFCRTECSHYSDKCMQLGIKVRKSAFHLNEILNVANPASHLSWDSSSCQRTLNTSNNEVTSAGADCTEWMSQFSDQNRAWKTVIQGDLQGQIAGSGEVIEVVFNPAHAPTFLFVWDGLVRSGGKIGSISHAPDIADFGPRLLISTDNGCFSID